jgi:uncharacterized OsmC-like protein
MGEVVYRSQVTVTRHRGPLRTATVPAEDRPLTFGVHGAVAEHYGTDPKDSEPHATTLDYLVAAAAGWLTGTFGGALEARGIPAGDGRLQADAVGEVELDGKVLVVRRIHVTYRLAADERQRATIDRVLGLHASRCPVARTIGGCVAISTSLDLQPVEAAP